MSCHGRPHCCLHHVGKTKGGHGPFAPAYEHEAAVYRCCYCGKYEASGVTVEVDKVTFEKGCEPRPVQVG